MRGGNKPNSLKWFVAKYGLVPMTVRDLMLAMAKTGEIEIGPGHSAVEIQEGGLDSFFELLNKMANKEVGWRPPQAQAV